MVGTRNRIGRGGWLAAGAAAGLVMGGAGVAVAAPTAPEIVACVGPDRVLRLPSGATSSPPASAAAATGEVAAECASSETRLTWSEKGPQGPQGPAGETGPAGPKGDAGISGLEWIYNRIAIPANDENYQQIFCPEGKVAISGSYNFLRAESPMPGFPLTSVSVGLWGQTPDSLPNEWVIRYRSNNPYRVWLELGVLCATAS
ncbi:hypothetical protein ACQP25_21925 [Microtetraspora malaysiensis]|uniref:hypothetical protein n=1 Tax=Microtetraspora malaysiensis TaxID=161358 RepID=UPI003D89BD2B